MAKFLDTDEINVELKNIIKSAEKQIILISPFIKLHTKLISALRTQKDNHKLKIIIVFGKNEEDLARSMKEEDFNFFKEFPKIQIRYEKDLHAKYYANETSAILTSMNLHSFSQNNNIEVGVLIKPTLLGNLVNNMLTDVTGEDSFDRQVERYFEGVIKDSKLVFHKIPEYDKGIIGTGLNKKYLSSKVVGDTLSEVFSEKTKSEPHKKEFSSKKEYQQPKQEQQFPLGYCIKTNERIPFNITKPLSYEAYKEWNKAKIDKEPGVYCHYSGELTYGKNSKERPVLNKYWKEAQAKFNIPVS